MYAIVSEECKLGPWSRVEGAPFDGDKQSICILGAFLLSHPLPSLAFNAANLPLPFTAKDVAVRPEVHVRSCIVLPSKILSKNASSEVLL